MRPPSVPVPPIQKLFVATAGLGHRHRGEPDNHHNLLSEQDSLILLIRRPLVFRKGVDEFGLRLPRLDGRAPVGQVRIATTFNTLSPLGPVNRNRALRNIGPHHLCTSLGTCMASALLTFVGQGTNPAKSISSHAPAHPLFRLAREIQG